MARASLGERARARSLFVSHYAQFRDCRAAARVAGISERTGRRWCRERDVVDHLDAVTSQVEHELTSFLGREPALRRVWELREEGARLITVVGPPGIGKTRLVLQFHRRCLERGEASFFCDVRDATTTEALCLAVGRAAGIQLGEKGSFKETIDGLGRALDACDACTLILDNFEQLPVEAATALRTWLGRASKLRFVVTSRSLLRVRGEQVYELGPLELPATAEDVTSPAVQLFVNRARSVEPRFDVEGPRARLVVELVRRLEGVPLLIELAAGQMRRTSLSELLRRLEGHLLELEGHRAHVEGPHATLRAAIDGSWSLLSPVEQAALCQLTVFRGGFTPEAAQAVLDLSTHDDVPEIADLLAALRDASLLRVQRADLGVGSIRWNMYASIREYGEDKLTTAQAFAAKDRHARWCLRFGDENAASKVRGRSDESLALVRCEIDNLRAAFDWIVHRDGDRSSSELGRLARILFDGIRDEAPSVAVEILTSALRAQSGSAAGGESRLESAQGAEVIDLLLDRAGARRAIGDYPGAEEDLVHATKLGPSPERAGRIAFERAIVTFMRGRPKRALDMMKHALANAERLDDRVLQGQSHSAIAWMSADAFCDVSALDHYERAMVLLAETSDLGALARTRMLWSIHRGYFRRSPSRKVIQDAVSESRRRGDRWCEASGLMSLGMLHHDEGRLAPALQEYEASREVAARAGLRYPLGSAELMAGLALDGQGDGAGARAAYHRALVCYRAVGGIRTGSLAEIVLAGRLARDGDPDGSFALVSCAEARLESGGDVAFRALAKIQYCQVELARACVARAMGEIGSFRELRARLSERVETVKGLRVVSRARENGVSESTLLECSILARILLELLEGALHQADTCLTVWADGSTLQVGDEPRVAVPSGPAIRRILQALADRRVREPGAALTADDLIGVGWPVEKMRPDAATNRLHNTLARLRQLGLGEHLLRRKEGYFLDPTVPISVCGSQGLS